jgi:hypothetical protein
MQEAIVSVIGLLLRHGLTALGTYGVAVSDSTSNQIVAGALAAAGLVWSFIQKKRSGAIPPKTS